MDLDVYYDRKSDGSYVVHFPNNKGLSKDTIGEIFSSFGTVLSIDNRGRTHGLWFVRYQKLVAAKNCILGLENHADIKILPHKNKGSKINAKQGLQDKDQAQSNVKNGLWRHQSDTNMSIKSTNTSDNGMENEDLSDTSLNSSLKTVNDDGHSIRKIPALQHLRLKSLQRTKVNNSFPSEACNESTKKPQQIFDTSEIPALVPVNQSYGTYNTKSSKLSTVVVLAQEVIVANIHPSLSIHYILHLFEKYNPIAVSLMMTTPKSGIRYCHVYYKTSQDAFATVEEFDNCLLRGKNLMVLTSQELMEEARLS